MQRDSAALDLDQLKATLNEATRQAVAWEQRNETLRTRMTERRREIEVHSTDMTMHESCCASS